MASCPLELAFTEPKNNNVDSAMASGPYADGKKWASGPLVLAFATGIDLALRLEA